MGVTAVFKLVVLKVFLKSFGLSSVPFALIVSPCPFGGGVESRIQPHDLGELYSSSQIVPYLYF